MDIDVSRITETLIIATITGGVGWIVGKTMKNARDINEAFFRIRELDLKIFPDRQPKPQKRKRIL